MENVVLSILNESCFTHVALPALVSFYLPATVLSVPLAAMVDGCAPPS